MQKRRKAGRQEGTNRQEGRECSLRSTPTRSCILAFCIFAFQSASCVPLRRRRRRDASLGGLFERIRQLHQAGSLHAIPVKLTPKGAGFALKPSGNGGVGAFGTSPKGTITVG